MKKHLLLTASLVGVGLTGPLASAEVGGSKMAPAVDLGGWTLQYLGLAESNPSWPFFLDNDTYINEAGQVSWSIRNGPSRSSWFYDGSQIYHMGLLGENYISKDGQENSRVGWGHLNESGVVAGVNWKAGDGVDENWWESDKTGWLFKDYKTIPVGLMDSDHTNSDGLHGSTLFSLNEAGQLAGKSFRYDGNEVAGVSAWFYDGNQAQRIGLYDRDHTRSDGFQASFPIYGKMNESGQVLGVSGRYVGADIGVDSFWLFDGTQTLPIGLYGEDQTRADGYQDLKAYDVNEAGQVLGSSTRYSGQEVGGKSVWLYNGNKTLRIGLFDGEHTRGDGFQQSDAPTETLNEAGQAVGYSYRYSGANELGQSAWFFDGSDTSRIGFTDGDHTDLDGVQSSTAVDLNDSGDVIGTSIRYKDGDEFGQSAWLYRNGQTLQLGLVDDDHTAADGFQSTTPIWLGDSGQAAGTSERFFANRYYRQQSAWFFDGSQTRRIGLTGPDYTETDNGYLRYGQQYSEIHSVNKSGQVLGWSSQYISRTAIVYWVYDPATDKTHVIDTSMYTYAALYFGNPIKHFGDDGSVLFSFISNDFLGKEYSHDFLYTIEGGLVDLDSLIGDNVRAQNNWGIPTYFARTHSGYILGNFGDDESPFILSPKSESGSNIAPSVTITSPPHNAKIDKDSLHTITVDTSDSDGYVTKVSYYLDTALISTKTEAPFSLNLDDVLDDRVIPSGKLKLTAVAYDNNGNMAISDYAVVYISRSYPEKQPPDISIVSPTTDSQLVEGSQVTLSVDATDEDGFVTKVEYYAYGSDLFATATEAPFSISVDSVPYGTFDITAVAYDSDGNSTTSEVVTLTVSANDGGNNPPSISITSPLDNSELIEGAPVTFTVDASDADGSVTKVEYYAFGDQLFGTVTEAPFTLNVDRAPYGKFDITAVVYDDKGASTVSPDIVVKVVEPTIIVD